MYTASSLNDHCVLNGYVPTEDRKRDSSAENVAIGDSLTPDQIVGKRNNSDLTSKSGKYAQPAGEPSIVINSASVAGTDVVAQETSSGGGIAGSGGGSAGTEGDIAGNGGDAEDSSTRSSREGCLQPSGAPTWARRRSSTPAGRCEKLRNLLSNNVHVDTLHSGCSQATGCKDNKCIGSLLEQPPSRPDGAPRAKDELIVQAKDFISQYYAAIKRLHTTAHKKRWQQILDNIEKRGTYDLSSAELTFGAKTAWRNAPRCIGRIQWSKLQVFDARHIRNTRGMFEALCNHIKYGTNKGNIRSTITVFPPRVERGHDFRVWNAQLIRYAGYTQADGSVIGDPANCQFTKVCELLGWQGRGGRFDVLPLVLQADGKDPELFRIPPELVLEVKLTHPNYPWFEALGLRWYALPAVANMLLDCGGIEFTCVPFNGWYMGTEIGARDLCDPGRYNLAKAVAGRMGLDTRATGSLWQDRAVIEVNVAVLHSYQCAGVTLIDHHAASASFVKHFESEHRLRGGCPADWVWITPPVSGSLCPVFHQEMLNYKLKPSYEYLDEPWKTHVWQSRSNADVTTGPRKKWRFKDVARAIKFSTKLMRSALAKRIKCTIMYASETGNSERCANSLVQMFRTAFDARVMAMDDYDIIELEHETLVLIVTSTFGNGDPPENGRQFAKDLSDLLFPKDSKRGLVRLGSVPQTLTMNLSDNPDDSEIHEGAGQLSNVRYSVFGLGSTAYPNFCAFGKLVDDLLSELSAESIHDMATGDELCGQQEAFTDWSKETFKAACETFCIEDQINMEAASAKLTATDKSWTPSKYRLSHLPTECGQDICENLSKINNKRVVYSSVLSTRQLQSTDSQRQTINVRLATNQLSGIGSYDPGDHVAIFPSNRPELVDAILAKLHNAPSGEQLLVLEVQEDVSTPFGEMRQWRRDGRLPVPFTMTTALSRYLDITSPPSPGFLNLLSKLATKEPDKEKLKKLANDQQLYDKWKYERQPNLVEVLHEFASVQVLPTVLLSQLPLLLPRYYSISSAPDMHPDEIHITVAVVTYRTHGDKGAIHYGVCSNWLNSLQDGSVVPCTLRSVPQFHLPADPAVPLVMVGPGTGLAPFRAFWQQRVVDRSRAPADTYGGMSLFFGCRRSDVDDLYKDEKQAALHSGALTQLHTALSREPGLPKTYVQNLLMENCQDIFHQVVDDHAHFYVCGDVSMAADVKQTLEQILQKVGSLTSEDARNYVLLMRESNRLHEDIFGVTLRTFEVEKKAREQAQQKTWDGVLRAARRFTASLSPVQNAQGSRDHSHVNQPETIYN